MVKITLWIYDKLKKNPVIGWLSFIIITALLVFSFIHLSYKEDISDFLPLDEETQTALSVYQDISGANRIYAIISTKDTVDVNPDELVEGIESFVENIEQRDSLHFISDIRKDIDMENILGMADFVYENIPYFIQGEDYQRIDSLLAIPNYIDEKLAEDKQMLLFPSSNVLTANISRDPLDLFSPILERLKQGGMNIDFDTYDGYILTPDGTKAIVILESSFGARESENNSKLANLLEESKNAAQNENANIDIHIIGGPVIAVANADRIKKDSILAITIAGILILALLIYVFRSFRNILLIVISIGWGWLFAMAAIALYYDSISIIVIGITSVILGIAVNYPLHLIDHLKSSSNPRFSLGEIVSPLIVGNITTVGAFLCLVPLNSPALHDLGLFSSLLLVGTILFVLIFLPHVIKIKKLSVSEKQENLLLSRIANFTPEDSKIIVCIVLALTIVFGYFSFKTEFDSDIRNINYMTDEQKADMSYFSSLANQSQDSEEMFVVSFGENWNQAIAQSEKIKGNIDKIVQEGLASKRNEVSAFLTSEDEQVAKIDRWNEFVNKYSDLLSVNLTNAALNNGFNETAFEPFNDVVNNQYEVKNFDEFKDFINSVFIGTLSTDNTSGKNTIVQTLIVPKNKAEEVRNKLKSDKEFGGMVFDVKSMNGSIANSLSDDFNYIGFVCGAIVFFFLWLSLGRIELAIISFLPMAVSWVWILGIMGMLGIKFNIVNIILATFIFGQGDDYTIFITEGLSYEYAYRKKVMASYKNSIVVSALIMFIGIGTLLFAKHPAMHSLGQVTVIGMLSVVLMAYLFPPLVFKWMVYNHGKVRLYPITVKTLFKPMVLTNKVLSFDKALKLVYGRYIYKGVDIERNCKKNLRTLKNYRAIVDDIKPNSDICILDYTAQGELAILLSFLHPDCHIKCWLSEEPSKLVLKGCLIDLNNHIEIVNSESECLEASTCAYSFVIKHKDTETPSLLSETILIEN